MRAPLGVRSHALGAQARATPLRTPIAGTKHRRGPAALARRPVAPAPAAPARAPRRAPRAAAAPDGRAPGAGGLTDAALADLAARLAPMLAPGVLPGGALEAKLESELDDWAAKHLPAGATRPSALIPSMLRTLGGGAPGL